MALLLGCGLSTHIPTGMPLSDQYVKLEEERRHRQRLEKDKRKKKTRERERRGTRRHSSLHTESDEDIAPAQRVDIVTEEMPEVSCSPCPAPGPWSALPCEL